jgi:DNA-directed RNA polymerase specialized sigma24 family protein
MHDVEASPMNMESWRQIYEAAFPRLYRGLIAIGARPAEAEDALHDAFLDALGKNGELQDLRRPDGWLFVVAARRWRRQRFRERIFAPFSSVQGACPAPSSDRVAVLAEVAKLPMRQRQVLVSRYVLDLSQEETAELLGIARGTVAAATTQAAATLRERLGNDQ